MGDNFFLNWFRKTADQLKAIREKHGHELSAEQLKELDNLITQKENEEKSK